MDGRRLAALRVKERQERESKRWSVDGCKRRSKRSGIRPLTTTSSLRHSTPWNERFAFEDTPLPKKISTSLRDGKENVAKNNSRPMTTSNAGTSSTSKKQQKTIERHFSDRSDGDLVLSFMRREMIAPAILSGGCVSPLLGGMRDVSVSPFDIFKLKQALEADDWSCSSSEGNREAPEQNECRIDCNEASADLDAFEELLYEMEIDDELARRELLEKTCLEKSEKLLDYYEVDDNECVSAAHERDPYDSVDVPWDIQEEIYNYTWYNQQRANERDMKLFKNSSMQFHEVVEA